MQITRASEITRILDVWEQTSQLNPEILTRIQGCAGWEETANGGFTYTP